MAKIKRLVLCLVDSVGLVMLLTSMCYAIVLGNGGVLDAQTAATLLALEVVGISLLIGVALTTALTKE